MASCRVYNTVCRQRWWHWICSRRGSMCVVVVSARQVSTRRRSIVKRARVAQAVNRTRTHVCLDRSIDYLLPASAKHQWGNTLFVSTQLENNLKDFNFSRFLVWLLWWAVAFWLVLGVRSSFIGSRGACGDVGLATLARMHGRERLQHETRTHVEHFVAKAPQPITSAACDTLDQSNSSKQISTTCKVRNLFFFISVRRIDSQLLNSKTLLICNLEMR